MKKSLIALVAALVVLGLVLVMNKRYEAERGKQLFVFDSTQSAQMGSLHVSKGADTALLEWKDGKWVTAKDAWTVDTTKINKIVKVLYTLQTQEVVSRNPDRAAEYGLDTASAKRVSWKDKSGKQVADVVIGKTSSADFSSTYWKFFDKPEVYRTSGNFTWDIATRNDDWKERKFYGFPVKDMQFLDVTWKDSLGVPFSYRLEAVNDSTWRMLSPAPSPVKSAVAKEIFSRITEMQVDEFMPANDSNKAKIQLDSPMVSIKIELKGGKTSEIKASKVFNYYAYAKHPDRSDTVKMSSWRFDALKKKPFELVEPVVDTTHKDSSHAAAPAPVMVPPTPAAAVPAKP